MDSLVTDLGARAYSFVDSSLLQATAGLETRVHPFARHRSEPVLQASEPWEGQWLRADGVHFDESVGKWRMWYGSEGPREIKLPGMRKDTLHLAESDDGIHWEKRGLGVVEVGGRPTNLCAWEDGTPAPGARCVFIEPDEPDPSKRYRMLWYGPNYYLAYSADGIRWRPAQEAPVWPNGAGDGLEETSSFLRDEITGRYRGYMRIWRRHQTIRKVGMGESDDLHTWTGPKIVWEAQPHYGVGGQIYGMHVYNDAGLYWGLPWVFFTDEPLDEELRQTIRLRMAWSRDGVDWHTLAPQTDAVEMGRRGSGFDAGMISFGTFTWAGDEGRLYYTGCNTIHTGQIVSGDRHMRHIGLATTRRGGLASLAAEKDGALITTRFVLRGEGIRINARTQKGGWVKAELINDSGNLIRGFTLEESGETTGDQADAALNWSGSSDLSKLEGQFVMLRLVLHKAEVFGFRLAGSRERLTAPLGRSPVRAGKTSTPPTADGQLNEDVWQNFSICGVAADFVHFDRAERVDVQTRALLAYDEKQLYIAVECDEPHSEKLPAARQGGAINYAGEDVVEVRLIAPSHGPYCHQLMVSSTGAQEHNVFSKEAGGLRPGLTAPWQAKTSVMPGRWVAEMAVPWESIEAPAPHPGERWRLNIIRYRQVAGDERSCWSCVFGSVHRNDVAGPLVFE